MLKNISHSSQLLVIYSQIPVFDDYIFLDIGGQKLLGACSISNPRHS
ncbi:hypothetical protein Goklo_024742 [Gossypium klotzschianum]|uniref:Uncharacterized protein n=1 Tax=Gossypium klotzschianum TaxID=34286 RepID=A0A7J8WC76_9ROSI|nr:hypothetical protein [Gossypium klotzschianum]